MKSISKFKDKLQTHFVLGCFSKTTDSGFIEIIGKSGFDFVILDMEHGPIGFETLQHHLRAAEVSDLTAIVRVPAGDMNAIGKALDAGAGGIQMPSVQTAEQAAAIVKAAKFFPSGERGVCRFVRAASYSATERKTYFKESNECGVVLQLEGIAGIQAFDSIIETAGIDVIFIGPYDLSQSLGVPGEIEHPKVLETIQELVQKAKARNIVLGIFCDTPDQLHFWKAKGLRYLAYSVDVAIFLDSLKNIRNLSNQ